MPSFIIEFVAVFLGVSLSFLVEDYRERRSDRKRARQVLRGIRSDIEDELKAVRWLVDVLRPSARDGLGLYWEWSSMAESRESAEATLGALQWGAPYVPGRAHYETAKSTGALGLIGNEPLERSIASIFEQQQGYLRSVSQIQVAKDFDLISLLGSYVEYQPSSDAAQSYVVPSEVAVTRSVKLLPGAVETLVADDAARNCLFWTARLRAFFTDLLENYTKEVQALDMELQKALSA
jgi:hypothetical protein